MHASVFPLLAASIGSASAALQVDLGSHSSIQTAAKDVAFDTVSFYKGNKTGEVPGILGLPPTSTNQDGYWWWTGSIFWSTLIDHWRYTGDDTYNGLVSQGLLHQAGEDNDFMHPNWTTTLAEDDLGFWGMAAMQAAELKFPAPGQNGLKSWLDLASNVFESKALRLNAGSETCNGGFRWQIFPINNGYNYKNAISTAVFINLGGRLARYTGNETYSKLAESSWVWLTEVGFIDDKNNVFDGGHVEKNCTDINKAQFSYTPAVLLEAAAHLYNHTTGEPQTRWRNRLDGMTKRTLELFFENGTHFEVTCEGRRGACNSDMLFFKGITLRALANVAQLAPHLHDEIVKTFKTNAELAVKVCTGGDNGRLCGFSWLEGENDGLNKLPSELNALSALEVLLIDDVARKGLSTASQSSSSSGSGSGNGNGNSGGNSQQKLAGSAGSATRAAAPMLLAALFAALM